MNDILENTARVLRPFAKNKLAVGVSGGRDSMCLLHAVIACGVVEKNNITAVHVNHCLRSSADGDEEFVREYCARNGIAFCAFRVDVKKESANNGLTIEQAARNLRYGVFYDLIKSGAAQYVLTAHHALDNAETVLMHLFRGAGLDGLRGMSDSPRNQANEAVPLHLFRGARLDGLRGMSDSPRNQANEAVPLHLIGGARLGGSCGMNDVSEKQTGLPILRPFVNVYPRELDEYARANNIEYVTDETNFMDDADRNFIRLNVIPMIEKRYAGVVRAVNEFAAECRDVCAFLNGALDDGHIGYDRGAITVADEALRQPVLAARYVRRALGYFTVVDVTRDMITRTVALAHMRIGATVELAHGIRATREYGCVSIYLERLPFEGEAPVALGANPIDGLVVDIDLSDVDPKSVRGGAVDFDKLDGAVLRFRLDGDMFTPCGGKTKKLKQYFIDAKIPKRLRDRIPLVCRGNEVLVVVGMQISDKVKIDGDTSRRAVVRLRGEI